jgi:hypothetical protein
LQTLKAIYEFFGAPYPRASLAAVAVLGAILFGAVWLFAARQVEKDRQAASNTPAGGASREAAPGKASSPQKKKPAAPQVNQHSSGANSPNVVTGDNSKVDINGRQEK